MAGLWQRLLDTLRTNKSAKKRVATHNRRSLRVEFLERRQTMDATISGIVFNDTNANDTQNGAEVGLGGVQVQLFADTGTIGVFDVETTPIETVTSSTAPGSLGRYSFNVTAAGNYLVRQVPTQVATTGFAQKAAQGTQAVNISATELTTNSVVQAIDAFDLPASSGQSLSPTVTGTPVTSRFAETTVFGGERDISATRTSVGGVFDVNVSLVAGSNNVLGIAADASTSGSATLIYDGLSSASGSTDTNAGTADGAFSPTFDATAGGTAQGIRLEIGRDANPGSTINVTLRSASGTSTLSSALAIPELVAGQPTELLIPFTSFSAGSATLTALQSIEVTFIAVPSADIVVDDLGTYGQFVETINFANVPAMTIGNQVFRDTNNNGIFDNTGASPEVGIGNVTVELYNDSSSGGTVGTFDAGIDTLVTIGDSTATTSASGVYQFTGLLPGNYIVLVPASEFTTGGDLINLVSSAGVAAVDTNNTDKGAPISATAGAAVFAAAALTAAGEPTNDGDLDANTNLTLDLGFAPPTLDLVKTDSPDPVRVGNQITYTLTVTNTSPAGSGRNSTVTSITDTLPTGVTFSSGSFTITNPSGTGGSASNTTGSQIVTANLGTLAPGQIGTLTIIGTVAAGFTGTSLSNTASVTNAEGSTDTDDETTNIVPNIDLAIDKTIVGSVTTVGVGGTLTYRLALNNTTGTAVDPGSGNSIRVDDTLPAGFTAGTLPSGVVAGSTAGTLVWTIPSLAAGATATVDIPVTVSTTATPGPTNTNTATIRTDLLTGFNDTVSTNNTDSVNVTTEPRFDLLLTKDDGRTTAATGDLITYTLSVNNSGPSAATNVAVADTLPAQLTFVSAASGGSSFGTLTGQTLNGTLASVASGATTTITIVARVNANATGTSFTNSATITPANASQETGTRPNTATDVDTLTRNVALNITKADSTDPVVAGGANFTYTVTAFNSGTADAPNVLFSDPLPTGITFVSGTFAVNETTPRNGTVTFNSTTNRLEANLGTLLAGGNATTNRALITLTVQAAATAAAGTVTNTATLTSPDNTTGVSDGEDTTISRNFDVTVTKTRNTTNNVSSGESLVYTIIVSNTGVSTATNVSLTDPLPSNLTFVSVTSSAGTFSNQSGTITGTIPTLVQGSPVTVTVTTTVNNNTPDGTNISNTASVTAAGETTTTNNSATVQATVANTATLRGFVYIDSTRNNVRDTNETGIAGVNVAISGTINGSAVNRSTTTDANGEYVFTGLTPGVYTVQQTQPSNFTSAATNPGSSGGTAGTDQISTITLTGGANSTNNNFGETRVFSKRRFLASSSDT